MKLSITRPGTCQTGCVGYSSSRCGHHSKNVKQVTETDYVSVSHLHVRGQFSVTDLIHLNEGNIRRPKDLDAFRMFMKTVEKGNAA